MHWQAKLHSGLVLTGETESFDSLNLESVAEFSIVKRLTNFCLSIWDMAGSPTGYCSRNTPNEVVHVIDASPTSKVFVFEGTEEPVYLTKWGTGVFGPIEPEAPPQP